MRRSYVPLSEDEKINIIHHYKNLGLYGNKIMLQLMLLQSLHTIYKEKLGIGLSGHLIRPISTQLNNCGATSNPKSKACVLTPKKSYSTNCQSFGTQFPMKLSIIIIRHLRRGFRHVFSIRVPASMANGLMFTNTMPNIVLI